MRSANEEYVRGAAYHESAHIVAAAVQGLPLRKGGIRVDEAGAGFACYIGRQPDGSTRVGPDLGREQTIIAILAGQIAHGRFYPPVASGDANAADDSERVNDLLLEMYAANDIRWSARNELYGRARQLVEQYWAAIQGLAETLWAKKWSTEMSATGHREKYMDGDEIIDVLRQYGISAALEDD